jgi:hypothetical protein
MVLVTTHVDSLAARSRETPEGVVAAVCVGSRSSVDWSAGRIVLAAKTTAFSGAASADENGNEWRCGSTTRRGSRPAGWDGRCDDNALNAFSSCVPRRAPAYHPVGTALDGNVRMGRLRMCVGVVRPPTANAASERRRLPSGLAGLRSPRTQLHPKCARPPRFPCCHPRGRSNEPEPPCAWP